MASAKIKKIPVELDRTRHLVMDLNALDLAEELTGRNLLDEEDWLGLRAGDVKRLLFALMKHEDEALTLEEVGAMVHMGNLNEIIEHLHLAYRAAMPDAEEAGGADEGAGGEDVDPTTGPSPSP